MWIGGRGDKVFLQLLVISAQTPQPHTWEARPKRAQAWGLHRQQQGRSPCGLGAMGSLSLQPH